MNITRARQDAKSILGYGPRIPYNATDVDRLCCRLRLVHKKMPSADRRRQDIELAEKLETMRQENRHVFE